MPKIALSNPKTNEPSGSLSGQPSKPVVAGGGGSGPGASSIVPRLQSLAVASVPPTGAYNLQSPASNLQPSTSNFRPSTLPALGSITPTAAGRSPTTLLEGRIRQVMGQQHLGGALAGGNSGGRISGSLEDLIASLLASEDAAATAAASRGGGGGASNSPPAATAGGVKIGVTVGVSRLRSESSSAGEDGSGGSGDLGSGPLAGLVERRRRRRKQQRLDLGGGSFSGAGVGGSLSPLGPVGGNGSPAMPQPPVQFPASNPLLAASAATDTPADAAGAVPPMPMPMHRGSGGGSGGAVPPVFAQLSALAGPGGIQWDSYNLAFMSSSGDQWFVLATYYIYHIFRLFGGLKKTLALLDLDILILGHRLIALIESWYIDRMGTVGPAHLVPRDISLAHKS